MNQSEINDIRTIEDFKTITFSNYKKTQVKKALLNSLINENIERSCYWCCELICSSQFLDIWEIIILYIGKHVHEANPKLCIFVNMKYNKFKKIISKYRYTNVLDMRNNITVRKLFTELICVLSYSNVSHSLDKIKIDNSNFDLTVLQKKLKAPNMSYANDIFQTEDPKELFIAINELAYNLNTGNTIMACYWFEWIIAFETKCKKQKQKCICERRLFVTVEEKHQKDIVWIIWDIIFNEKTKKNNKLLTKIIDALFSLFSIRYTSGSKKKRRFIVYFAISLLCKKISIDKKIINKKNVNEINIITSNINKIYSEIKKNEIAPKTDYLFHGTKKDKVKRSLGQMELVNSLIGYESE